MPTYFVTWTAIVHGSTRVDADNGEKAAKLFLDTEPQLDSSVTITKLDVVDVEEAAPGVTWN